MLKGQYSFEVQCSLPCLTTLTAASAYSSTKQIRLCWTKIHQTSWHQITFGVIGPQLHYHSHCAISNAGDVQIVGVASVTKFYNFDQI